MKKKYLFFYLFLVLFINSYAQTITIVGTGVNGWPPNLNGPEIALSTTDNITYTIPNLTVTNGFVKFRQNNSWTINWGGSTFPSGQGTQGGPDIPTTAGTYDVTLNRSNGTYTFIPSTGFPNIGIWGPAVNSQLGFAAPDIDMTTTDGITYTLSGFYFSSGNAYFRQDNASNFVWGTVAFPTGTAVLGGPTIFIPGGEWFVTFNRITGDFSFTYPSVGILGSALNGFTAPDTDLTTTNGFNYTTDNLTLTNGTVKFRKDNSWTANWGALGFPTGTGTQDGPDIPVTAGTYNITFEKSSGNYSFTDVLSNPSNTIASIKVFPNPTTNFWNITNNAVIDSVTVMDSLGKIIQNHCPNTSSFQIDGSQMSQGIYYLKISSGKDFLVHKIIKN